MKILEITPAFVPSHFGGIKMQSYYLSRELAKRGHEVTVFTSNADDGRTRLDRKGVYDIEGMQVVYFQNYMPHRNLFLFITPSMVKALKEQISNYDILHLHGIRHFQSIITYLYSGKCNVPYVLTPHGSIPRVSNWLLLKRIFDHLLGNKILDAASRIIALTPAEVEQCREAGIENDRIVQSTAGISLRDYDNLPAGGAFRGKYNIKEERIILFLGRIHQIKGLDILARAFAEILECSKDVRLVIVGSDYGYYDQLKKILRMLNIEDRVTFTGFLAGEDKLEAYVDADVYVLPSQYESFSTTLLESLACGTPAVITDQCYVADMIQDHGVLVVPFDKDRLRDTLIDILENDEKRNELSLAGKLLVRDKFNYEKIAEKIEKVYQSVLTGKK